MIAICPSCHDAAHHSGISDETLYNWKKIPYPPTSEVRDHLYVAPSHDIRVLTGSMCVMTDDADGIVFRLSNANHFKFRILEGEIFFANCLIKDLRGTTLVRIIENYITTKKDKLITVTRRPGKISITMLDADTYLPSWVSKIMWRAFPDFVRGGQATILDIEVIRPGVVRLLGVFVATDAVLAITESKICLLRPELNGPLAIVGQGEDAVIKLSGPVTQAAFEL